MESLYFISIDGERHEDQIPIGVFNWNGIINIYTALRLVGNNKLLSEEDFEYNKFVKCFAPDSENFSFESEDLDFFKSDSFCTDEEECVEIFGPDGDSFINLWIIKIQVNQMMPGT